MKKFVSDNRTLLCELGVHLTQLSIAVVGISAVARWATFGTAVTIGGFVLFGIGLILVVVGQWGRQPDNWELKMFLLTFSYVVSALMGTWFLSFANNSNIGRILGILLVIFAYVILWFWAKVAVAEGVSPADVDADTARVAK